MRIALVASGLALTAVVGCSSSPVATKSEPAKGFTSKELHASFRVPASWSEPTSWNPLRSRPYAAKFEASSDDTAVVLAQAPVTGGQCLAAALAALRSTSDATLSVEREFKLATPGGELAAGQGGTSGGDRQGSARFFCSGGNAVVLEASAPKSTFSRRRAELEAIVDSLTFDADTGAVAVRAPAPPPPAAPSYFIHVVKFRGQTLGRLAEWYTGSYDNWPRLARANGEPVPNSPLSVGREIKIPSEIMVREDPPPEPRRRAPAPTRPAEPRGTNEAPSESSSPSGATEPGLPAVIGPR